MNHILLPNGCTPPIKSRRKGSALLVVVLMVAVMGSMTAISMAKVSQSTNNSLVSSGITAQAQSYAFSEVELIKSKDYSDLQAQNRATISGSDFQKEVTLSNESDYSSSIKQRTATIKVYKGSEIVPRSQINLVRYSVEQKSSGVPIGTIIAWASTKNPTDGIWLDCNGQSCARYSTLVSVLGKNTVPDYRNRFLEGSTSPNQVIEAGLPNITGYIPHDWLSMGDGNPAGAFYRTDILGRSTSRQGKKDGDWFRYMFDASRSSSIYGRSTTVQPPATTVRWLIRAA
jgi:hypothetical protein